MINMKLWNVPLSDLYRGGAIQVRINSELTEEKAQNGKKCPHRKIVINFDDKHGTVK